MHPDIVGKCLDKPFMLQLADELGVPTAGFALTRDAREFQNATRRLGFPLVIRPLDSTDRLGARKALILETEKAAKEVGREIDLTERSLILQQRFQGKRHN